MRMDVECRWDGDFDEWFQVKDVDFPEAIWIQEIVMTDWFNLLFFFLFFSYLVLIWDVKDVGRILVGCRKDWGVSWLKYFPQAFLSHFLDFHNSPQPTYYATVSISEFIQLRILLHLKSSFSINPCTRIVPLFHSIRLTISNQSSPNFSMAQSKPGISTSPLTCSNF